jgi:hypothetical protein
VRILLCFRVVLETAAQPFRYHDSWSTIASLVFLEGRELGGNFLQPGYYLSTTEAYLDLARTAQQDSILLLDLGWFGILWFSTPHALYLECGMRGLALTRKTIVTLFLEPIKHHFERGALSFESGIMSSCWIMSQ